MDEPQGALAAAWGRKGLWKYLLMGVFVRFGCVQFRVFPVFRSWEDAAGR